MKHPITQTIRNLLMDTPYFVNFDPYYTEFVLREGTIQFAHLIGEAIGHMPIVTAVQQDDSGGVSSLMNYIGPTNEACSVLKEEVPILMFSQTSFVALLFLENNDTNAVFQSLYEIAFTHDHLAFVTTFRQLVSLNDDARGLIQQLHALYADNQVPAKGPVQDVADEFMKSVYARVGGPAEHGHDVPKPKAKPFNPNTLN